MTVVLGSALGSALGWLSRLDPTSVVVAGIGAAAGLASAIAGLAERRRRRRDEARKARLDLRALETRTASEIIDRLEEQIDRLTRLLASSQSNEDRYRAEIDRLNALVDELRATIRVLTAKIGTAQQEGASDPV